jgi:LEA14-like dessication related protein
MPATPEPRRASISIGKRCFLLVATLVAAACASVAPKIEPPEVTLESVRVKRIVDNRAEISVELKLFNPNSMALPVKAVDYEVTLDGRPAARGHTVRVDTLPPRGDGKVELAGRVDVGAIATAMMTLGAQLPVAYAMTGTLTVEGWAPIAFSRTGKIPVSRLDSAFGSRPQ